MSYPREELITYRMNRAKEVMEEAELMAGVKHWHTCINRLYYACFYAVNALLIKHELASSKHSGVRAIFVREFVATGKINKDYGRLYQQLFKYRQQSDYEDFFSIEEDIVTQWLSDVKGFVALIEQLISQQREES